MEDNPFSILVQRIRQDNKAQIPVSFRFGQVISTAPLKIDVAGTIQESDALLKNDALNYFEVGDKLLLIPIEDEQRYVIICKVVSV